MIDTLSIHVKVFDGSGATLFPREVQVRGERIDVIALAADTLGVHAKG